jgi:hypothetical protein
LLEHECPRCRQPVELPLGEICDACRRAISARATRIARRIAMISTAALGVYVMLRVPPDPTARLVSGVSVALWYLMMYLVAKRVLTEVLK